MSASQKIILTIFVIYLALNAIIGIVFSKRQGSKQNVSSEKKFFIGGRNMNGLLLAMTTMATYTSVSSFISGPGAAGLTYGYAQAWIATVQVPVTFLVLGVLGNKLAMVSRRTGAVTVVGYLKARYKSDALVIITSLLMVAFFMAQMIGQFTGGATLISSITGLNHVVSILIFGAVVIIYTSFGGFSADCHHRYNSGNCYVYRYFPVYFLCIKSRRLGFLVLMPDLPEIFLVYMMIFFLCTLRVL